METDRRVLPFSDIVSESTLAHMLGVEASLLERVAARNVSGEAPVRIRTKKIRGKSRRVQEPLDEELKQTLNAIVHMMNLQTATLLRRSSLVHGYVPGRSAFTNAKAHVGSDHVQKFDIRGFFDAITSSMVLDTLIELGMSRDAATLLTRIVLKDGRLPLGFAPSPLISNLVMRLVDNRLFALAEDHGIIVTRYADDITFSSPMPFDVSIEVEAVLKANGFSINTEKSVTGRLSDGVHVTGFTVARDGPRLPRRLKRVIRQDLFHIARVGLTEQATVRRRTPESFARRMASRLGLLRATEPEYYAQLSRAFPTAMRTLENRRRASRERKENRRRRLARDLLGSPSPRPSFYEPSISYQRATSTGGASVPVERESIDNRSTWDFE